MSLISNKLLSMLLMLRTLLRLQSVPLIQANIPQTAVQVILEMCYFLRVIVTTYTHLGAKHHTGLICYKSERVRPGREAFYPVASIWMVCNTIFFLCLQHFAQCYSLIFYLLSVNGMEMMTPFPVPTHKRLQDTISAVILTNENPSLPVPKNKRCFSSKILSKNNFSSTTENLKSNSRITQTNNSLPLLTETK